METSMIKLTIVSIFRNLETSINDEQRTKTKEVNHYFGVIKRGDYERRCRSHNAC